MKGVKIDCFSGAAAELKGRNRTPENVLACLREHPRVSTWDMDSTWLNEAIVTLEKQGKIREDRSEPYPWHRFIVQSTDEMDPTR